MTGFVVNLTDYVPPARYDGIFWTQAVVSYSPDNVLAYVTLATVSLAAYSNSQAPPQQNFTVTNAPTAAGWLIVTWQDGSGNTSAAPPVQYPVQTGQGQANPTLLSARYGVRHRIRDGIPLLDAVPVPFNMVRLEELTDQIGTTPTATLQLRYDDVPTKRYLNATAVPGTLVAFVDNAWTPVYPSQDVDANGLFVLPVVPVVRVLVTYGWQYFSDGEIDQFVDEGRQWLREFPQVAQIPDGLVPALVSNASARALYALARSATIANVRAADSGVDWSSLAASYVKQAQAEEAKAAAERQGFYDQGPARLDPTVVDVGAVLVDHFEPWR